MAYDVIVVGGGLIGASLACALPELKLALVDAVAGPPSKMPGFDSRVYALSPGSVGFLRRLGVWDRIEAGAAVPVRGMQVSGDDGASSIGFDAWDCGVAELAWIVEDGVLQRALRATLDARGNLEWFAPARGAALHVESACASLELEGGTRMDSRLVVGADGAASFVRAQSAIAVREQAYGHSAVVANFACEKPHREIARQWFQGGPVLALLPLAGGHVSMVWSTHDAEAARLAALSPASLCGEVEQASAGALGSLSLVTPARTFPLRRLRADACVRHRIALVGDAAHVVHPLAGQGANLGFQDARVLAEVLLAREPGRDPGDLALLRRYERARAEAILAMGATVHGLFRLFDDNSAWARRARNAGLKLVDRMAVVKNLLIRQAMQ